MQDLATGVDDHPDPLRVATLSGLGGRAIGETHGPVAVAQQRIVERELLCEGLVVCRGVEADPEDGCVAGVVVGLKVAKLATLDGSTRGVGLWIEPQNQVAASVVGQAVPSSIVVEDGEVGGGFALSKHGYLLPAGTRECSRTTGRTDSPAWKGLAAEQVITAVVVVWSPSPRG